MLEEVKSAMAKAKDNMAWYYNQRRTPAPVYGPGDRVYLDASDIHTTRPSKKLSHRRLGPFPVERRIGINAYRLTLPPSMKHLHPVFNVVKLMLAPMDPIAGRHAPPPPPPELIDGEEEYVVEEIRDSRMFRRRLQYLVKWEGYGTEGNTWEYAEHVNNAPERVAEFHQHNPAAPHRICAMAFGSIPFCPISPAIQASRRCFSRGRVIVRGIPSEPSQTISDPCPSTAAARPTSSAAADHYSSPAVGRPLNPTARPFILRTHHRSHPSPSVDT